MADIEANCKQCEATLKVSEYVDIEVVKCRACGGPMQKPEGAEGETSDTYSTKIRLASAKPPPEPTADEADDDVESRERNRKLRSFFPKRLNRPAKKGKRSRSRSRGPASVIRYWIVFAIALILTMVLRRGGILTDPSDINLVNTGVLIYFGFLHICLVTQAFHEDVFQGVLCIFIPFYSVYYLLTQTDALMLRAVSGALLLSFGDVLVNYLAETSIAVYYFVDRWIISGATL